MRTQLIASSIVIVCITNILLFSLTPYGSATSPDSIYYFSAANHLLSGHGFVLSNYTLGATEGYTQLTTWPPLYPLLLTVFSQGGNVSAVTASYAAMAVFSLSSILMLLLLRPLNNNIIFAMVGVLLFILSQPILTIFTYAWSESLFIFLLLSVIWVALRVLMSAAENCVQQHFRYLMLFAFLLAALFYCRYVGIVFAGLWLCVWWLSPLRQHIKHFIVSGLFYLATLLIIIIRNYQLTGDIKGSEITGAHRLNSNHSLIDNLTDLGQVMQAILPAITVVFIALIIMTAIVVLHRWVFKTPFLVMERKNINYNRWLWQISLFALIIYIIGLVILRTITDFDRIDMRYFSIIMTLLIIIFMSVFSYSISKPFQLFFLGTIVVTFLLQGIIFYQSQLAFLRETGKVQFVAFPQKPYNNFSLSPWDNTVKNIMHDLLELEPEVFITERPDSIIFMSGLATNQIKFRQFPDGKVNDEVINKLNASGRTGIILLNNYHNSFERILAYYNYNSLNLPLLKTYLPYRILVFKLPLPLISDINNE